MRLPQLLAWAHAVHSVSVPAKLIRGWPAATPVSEMYFHCSAIVVL